MRSRWTALLRKILAPTSVDLVELVMAMEEEFELDEIPEEELTSLKTVGDCVRYLSTKLG